MKVTNKLLFDKKEIGKIIFDSNDFCISKIKKQINRSISELNKFYKIKIPKINIELIYSKTKFDEIIKRKSPNWLVGITIKNKIYIFSPLCMEKYTSHNKKDFNKNLNHEICHLFNMAINKKLPTWIDEGSALYLSKQKKNHSFNKSDWLFFINKLNSRMTIKTFTDHNGYKIAYHMTDKIVKKRGLKYLLKLIKEPSRLGREGLFES